MKKTFPFYAFVITILLGFNIKSYAQYDVYDDQGYTMMVEMGGIWYSNTEYNKERVYESVIEIVYCLWAIDIFKYP